jgi:hypothetical protein
MFGRKNAGELTVTMQLRQASGSPWRGEARQVTWLADGKRLELGALAWSWMPAEVLNGRLGFAFELGQPPDKLRGSVLLGRNGHSLKNVRGRVDAAVLGFASLPFGLLEPRGSLMLEIPDLYLGGKRIHGGARMDWQDARSGMVAAPLGSYRMQLIASPDGRRARITAHTLDGELTILGEGEYLPGKGLQGSLRLTPPQDERRNLYSPILSLLGRPDASGTWTLSLTAR